MSYSRLTCIRAFDSAVLDLVLDGVDVSVSIVDMHAQVRMSQRFTNPFQIPVDATYTFSILANSAVCGFEMIRCDGTIVHGKVMEKRDAREAYNTAVLQGQTASLGEEQTKDMFNVKVGNIPPLEPVMINLTFLTPLIDDEKRDQVRFTFPRGYTSRYGTPFTPGAADAFSDAGWLQAFNIAVTVQQSGPIKAISCPSSHPIQVSLGRPDGVVVDSTIPESHLASVKMTSPTAYLTQDFVLVVTADGLDAPRCFVEPSLTPNENTTAFGMTFVPRFTLPDVEGGMEFIFVVDRSGSMKGTSIKLVKEALIVLLRGLPTNDTTFNIFSFGKYADSLWPTSKEYTQSTLEEATQHVDLMKANYGGTEIAIALRKVTESLPQNRQKPVSVFLMTDGAVWNISSCEDIARGLVSSPGTFARIFTVGIGSGASTNTVDSIARAGEGTAIYVQNSEPMTGKLARLVRASRTPPIKDLEILWPRATDDFEIIEGEEVKKQDANNLVQTLPPSISLCSDNEDRLSNDVGPPAKLIVNPEDIEAPTIQQAPLHVTQLFPGTRTQIYAIVSSLDAIPSSIKVRGKVATTDGTVELDIPISRASYAIDSPQGFLHTLAARALIKDREDGKHPFGLAVSRRPDISEAHLEADIIRLGTKYGLTTKHTSYVAIDERHSNQLVVDRAHTALPLPFPSLVSDGFGYSGFHSDFGSWFSMADPNWWSPSSSDQSQFFASIPPPPPMQPSSSSALPSLAHISRPPRQPKCRRAVSRRRESDTPSTSNPIQQSRKRRCAMPNRRQVYTSSSSDETPQDTVHVTEVGLVGIARLQQFDGSFALSNRLLKAISSTSPIQVIEAAFATSGGMSTEVMATTLALVWMKKEAEDEAVDMIEKAEKWLKKTLGEDFKVEEVMKVARGLL